ncbi:MAG: hypothetical protein IJT72_01700 [Lachnospiraceae bacterium]|nr:hypothetical protein [Lachnospiraceae bacterium]
MGLQLKTNNDNKDTGQPSNYASHKNDTSEYMQQFEYEPVVIKTDIPNIDEISMNQKKKDGYMTIIKIAVLFLVIAVVSGVVKHMLKKMDNTKDITKYVNKSEEEIEKKLNITLEDSPEKVPGIHHYSKGKVSVSSNGEISVIYIDGVQKGVKIESEKYSMFGLKLNDDANQVHDKTSYDFTDYFVVLTDMFSGKSTSEFYYNENTNDCLVVIVNDVSGRIVSLIYYNDFKSISQNLSGFDD